MTDFEDSVSLEIPAYLRGELSPEDMSRIEELAKNNEHIAADIEFQRMLMDAVKDDAGVTPVSEFEWARLSKAMNSDMLGHDTQETRQIAANDHDSSYAANSGPVPAANRSGFWKIAAAALAVVALGQAGVMASKFSAQYDAARYVTVSEEGNSMYIDLAFAKTAVQTDVTQLLQDVDGVFVSGPSALGLYKVKFKSKDACFTASKAFKANLKVVHTATKCL